jgi:hypothetical protein
MNTYRIYFRRIDEGYFEFDWDGDYDSAYNHSAEIAGDIAEEDMHPVYGAWEWDGVEEQWS